MQQLLLVGLGGFAGACARYGAARLAQRVFGAGFPTGTLAVNVAGCLAIGLLVEWVVRQDAPSHELRLLCVAGFLGSFTTFSAFGFETLELLRAERPAAALANVLANVGLGLGAVWLGREIAARIAG